MSRMIGTVSMGVRAPIIREGDDLVQIVQKEIPYISFSETKSRKLYQHLQYPFASVIRVETETKKFESAAGEVIEYYPQSTYVDIANVKIYNNKNNKQCLIII